MSMLIVDCPVLGFLCFLHSQRSLEGTWFYVKMKEDFFLVFHCGAEYRHDVKWDVSGMSRASFHHVAEDKSHKGQC